MTKKQNGKLEKRKKQGYMGIKVSKEDWHVGDYKTNRHQTNCNLVADSIVICTSITQFHYITAQFWLWYNCIMVKS